MGMVRMYPSTWTLGCMDNNWVPGLGTACCDPSENLEIHPFVTNEKLMYNIANL